MTDSFEAGQTWCATLAWRGDAYAGWQVQPNAVTVQQMVQEAVGRLCGLNHPLPVRATGRTDAGVHAEMQLVGFQTPVPRTSEQVRAGINFHTPRDIVCLEVVPMPEGFSPRGWTKRKLYRYRVLNRVPPCPFREGLVWHLKPALDVATMQQAVPVLVGQHDFSSFQASGCAADSPVRTLQAAAIHEAQGGEVHFEFEGHGFLRHQVRIMVGTLVDVGLGKRAWTDVQRILGGRDRRLGGATAPAHGLTLVHVTLAEGPRG